MSTMLHWFLTYLISDRSHTRCRKKNLDQFYETDVHESINLKGKDVSAVKKYLQLFTLMHS